MKEPGWIDWNRLGALYDGFIKWQIEDKRSIKVRVIRLWPPWPTDKKWPWVRYSMMLVRDERAADD